MSGALGGQSWASLRGPEGAAAGGGGEVRHVVPDSLAVLDSIPGLGATDDVLN